MSSKAISAWQAGSTGKGVKIAIIDSGINPDLAEFAGRIDAASRDVAGTRPLSDEDGHGTAVAATAAGARNDLQNLGVAFDATIIALRADAPGTCADTSADGGCNFFDSAIASGVDAARLAGARVINMSLGGDPAGSQLLAAIGRAVNAGIVIVMSAGNDGEDPVKGINSDPFAMSAAQAYPGQVIIAGALDGGLTQLAAFSNRAGTGSPYYLAALGQAVRTIDHTGTGYLYSGTSFSAPIITGAVALMAQAFPNLTGQQIISILLSSADDLGVTGNDTTFGHGRLNVQRAFQPIGTTTLAGTSSTVTAQSVSGALPEAAGDGSLAVHSLGTVILDGYSRAFALDLARSLEAAEKRRPLERALSGRVRTNVAAAGPVAVTLSVATRDAQPMVDLGRLNIGPEDARRSRLIAGNAIARLDRKTRIALGFSEGAKSLERSLSGASAGAFLVARDTNGEPGFAANRGTSLALRRDLGKTVGLTLSAETGSVTRDPRAGELDLPYRLATALIDKQLGRNNFLSLGATRLDERSSLLGGRIGATLGGGGSSSWFVDGEVRHDFGRGIGATLSARRGWTQFGSGKFVSSAYAFDLAKQFAGGDRLGLRVSQPIRIEQGGLSLMLPVSYDYDTRLASNGVRSLSLSPSGREIDAELSYATRLFGTGWIGANLYARRNPGHVASAAPDVGAAIRTSFAF
ncbi:MAG: S8 family serine peptidase [Sphingomonas bacterium]|nr:S8 family serine peptidase [Sphingomonas bacterium]